MDLPSPCLNQKNTIDPEKIISDFGADSVRLFILSDSPPEKDVQWSDEGIAASYKFIQKLWIMNSNLLEEIKKNHKNDYDNELDKITNNFIYKVTNNLTRFTYNKIIANYHEIYSEINSTLKKIYTSKTIIKNYTKIITCMMPVIPHFANECISLLKVNTKIEWPKINKDLLVQEKVNFVIQINGKKRGLITSNRNTSEDDLMKLINANDEIKKYIENQQLKKKIFIPNKLINIII